MSDRNYSDVELSRRLLAQVKPYWAHLGVIFLMSLLAIPLSLLMPLPLKIAVDSVIGSKPLPAALAWWVPDALTGSASALMGIVVSLLFGIGLLRQLQALGGWVLDTYVGEKLVLDFRARLFHHLQRMSLTYHDVKGTTDSVYRVQYDAPAVQLFSIFGLIPLITYVFMLVGMLWVIAALDWQISLVAMAVCPVLYLLTNLCRKHLREIWNEVKEYQSSSMSVVQEVLGAIRIVKAFTQEDREQERFLSLSRQNLSGQVRVAYTQGRFDMLVGLTMVFGEAAVLFIGVQHVKSGILSLGGLLMIMAYLVQLYQPLRNISKNIADLQSALASAARAFSVLDERPEVIEKPHARPCGRATGALRFEDVSFAYDADYPVLNEVTFHVPAGARVGITGTTGAGKTTLVSLIARFYDPSAGRILLDGIDLRDYKLADLRNQIAFVLQDTVLFSSSIRENIAYARADASEEEIIAAAMAANAHDFILDLPQGYGAQVGERGILLSGGQRQRIALARAFLKDAPIIILDEPTSAVDVKTEAAIMDAMQRLMSGRTTIMITHRPSTLDMFELQIRLEGGRIIAITASGSATKDAAWNETGT